jgi:hypothetical protein
VSDGYFHRQVSVSNGDYPQYPRITVRGFRTGIAPISAVDPITKINQPGIRGAGHRRSPRDTEQTISGHGFASKTPEIFSYDEDGNLLSDGRWSYQWDGEYRLSRMETLAAAASAGVPRSRVDFHYDWRGRRIQKSVSVGPNEETWVVTRTRYLYDNDWSMLAEVDSAGTIERGISGASISAPPVRERAG